MSNDFAPDPYPGRPKILFIGWAESSHTHAWIDLLAGAELNVRLFALPSAVPPDTWRVRTYVTIDPPGPLDPHTRLRVFPPKFRRAARLLRKIMEEFRPSGAARQAEPASIERALADVIRRWRPDVIHTLGFDPASYFYLRTRQQFRLAGIGTWVAQARGGPDLALSRYLPDGLEKIRSVLAECDQFVADNAPNYEFARSEGLAPEKCSPLGVVPGTGGMDVQALAAAWQGRPSQRERWILWPKAYEAPAAKALPVFEALRLAWDRIRPCRLHLLWVVQPEVRMWFGALPQEIRESCCLYDRLPREQVLEMMPRARVLLAPSLTDGVPNSLLEAMAAGAFPIVSPLETITPLVSEPENVLFARNLYPNEVAEALARAMSDDALVDAAAARNLALVRRVADRATIGPRVIAYYEQLARAPRARE